LFEIVIGVVKKSNGEIRSVDLNQLVITGFSVIGGFIALVLHPGREIALRLALCYFLPFLSTLATLAITYP